MKLNNKRRKLSEIRQINTLRKYGKVASYMKISNEMLGDAKAMDIVINDMRDVRFPKRVQRRFTYELVKYEIAPINDDFVINMSTLLKTFKAVEI